MRAARRPWPCIRDSVDLLFVGGKGGVGKTSVSAAIGFEWSARGARTLLGGGVGLRTIVVNRCLDGFEVGAARTLAESHRANVDAAFSRNPLAAAAKVEVPALHTGSELGGVFGLKYFGSRAFEGDAAAAALDGIFAQREAKLVVCGGKGGVGKTTVSSALGVALADRGSTRW
ncbi:ATPase [Aureococcus anophagefferens]|nr:ATPase [Aureococcus anophagefferens]